MKNNKRFTVGIIVVAIFAVFSVILLIISSSENGARTIILPSSSNSGDDSAASAQFALVTPETVQAVINSIDRPLGYSRTVTIKNYWSGGSSSYTVAAYVSASNARISITSPHETKNILITGDEMKIWYGLASTTTPFTGSLSEDFTHVTDKYQSILTYEDLLSVDTGNILEAGYMDFNGEYCIFVRFLSRELGYTDEMYISPSSGLIMGAYAYDGDTLIYSAVSDTPDLSEPSEGLFVLS